MVNNTFWLLNECIDNYNSVFINLFKDNILIDNFINNNSDMFIKFDGEKFSHIDDKIYDVRLYTDKFNNKFIIVGFDHIRITDIIKNKQNIPNIDILLKSCKTHMIHVHAEELEMIISSENELHEKILEQKRCNTEKIEQPTYIDLQLYDYQKKNIKYMIEYENKKKIINKFTGFIINDKIYYDAKFNNIYITETLDNYNIIGGGLFDEVGLGKTIQIISLALENEPQYFPYIQNENLYGKGTLIICPNHIGIQWANEFRHVTKKIKIIELFTKLQYNNISYMDLLNADFVIVTYGFLLNKCYLDRWEKRIIKWHNGNIKKTMIFNVDLKNIFEKFRKNFMNNVVKKILYTNPEFFFIKWNRIVVDEFHELFTNAKYSKIIKLLPIMDSNNRWCITGTPFASNNSIKINNYIEFITKYENPEIDIIENKDTNFSNYIINNSFIRNTKKEVENEFKLDKIIEEPIFLNFTPAENAIYESYLINDNHSEDDIFIRQLCCFPKMINELKDIGGTKCETLEEISNVILKKYKFDIEKTENDINIIVNKFKNFYAKLIAKLKHTENGNEEIKKEINKIKESFNKKTLEEIKIIVDKHYIKKNKVLSDKVNDTIQKYNTMLKDADKVLLMNKSTYNFFNSSIEKIKLIKDGSENQETCCVCLSEIPKDSITLTKCGHIFCHNCIIESLKVNNKCPLCKEILYKSDIKIITDNKKNNIQYDYNIDKMIEQVGTKMAHLISYLINNKDNLIIFSEWDEMLHTIGKILSGYNIKNVFCRGNVYQCNSAIRSFNEDEKIKIIMLSATSAASGTNLTKANKIIFVNPIYGDETLRKNIEWQAIGRVHRLGQKQKIKVVRFIINDTIEHKIYSDSIVNVGISD